MKAQFKYAFLAGLSVRGITFGIVFAIMFVFIILGSLDRAPMPALITAVSLGGVGIGAVAVVNIISDIAIVRRMFAAPGAYLYALTPTHRGKTLFASVITMLVLDIVTMAIVITGEVWLSLLLAGEDILRTVTDYISTYITTEEVMYILCTALLLVAGYLFVMMVILFCMTARRSLFYQKPAAGLLTFLLGCACFYAFSLLQLVMIPLGSVSFLGSTFLMYIEISSAVSAIPVYALLLLLSAAGLFVLTSRFLERKINI